MRKKPMVRIEAKISRYAATYVGRWAKHNEISIDQALDEILSSVRRDAEGIEE